MNVEPADKVALSIAGSDPSGGAGIQADLKTFTVLNVYGGAVITCLTAQNSLGVSSFRPVEPSFVKEQILLVLDDLPVTHIKTGMIGTGAMAVAVGEALQNFQGVVTCDPVLRASDGKDLLEPMALAAFQKEIVGRADFVTPNVFELEQLTGSACGNEKEALQAAQSLLDAFPKLTGVILTGGHLTEEERSVTDFFIARQGSGGRRIIPARHERRQTKNTHGTGCTFASAFTAYHLRTGDGEKSFHQAVAFMDQVIQKSAALCLGKGKGPLAHHLFRA